MTLPWWLAVPALAALGFLVLCLLSLAGFLVMAVRAPDEIDVFGEDGEGQ